MASSNGADQSIGKPHVSNGLKSPEKSSTVTVTDACVGLPVSPVSSVTIIGVAGGVRIRPATTGTPDSTAALIREGVINRTRPDTVSTPDSMAARMLGRCRACYPDSSGSA